MCRSFRSVDSPSPVRDALACGRAAECVADAGGAGLGWLSRAPNILLIPGTSSPDHLRENLASAGLKLPDEMVAELNRIGGAASPGASV